MLSRARTTLLSFPYVRARPIHSSLIPRAMSDEPEAKRRRLDAGEGSSGSASTSTSEAVASTPATTSTGGGHSPKTSGRGRFKKGDFPTRRDRIEAPREQVENEIPEVRLPKRNVALLLGFCGSGYHGMQYSTREGQLDMTHPSIEGTLFQALIEAGAISRYNSSNPLKVNFQRAARTDRGVHAAGNVVSFKMIMNLPDKTEADMLAAINAALPPQIRVWEFIRTKNSFNARQICDSRRYTYFFPSYLLITPKPGCGFRQNLDRFLGEPWEAPADPFWEGMDENEFREAMLNRKRAWRVTPEHLNRLKEAAAVYQGTHSFHNFTLTTNPTAGTNKRYMKSLEVQEPQVHDGTEWIPVQFHGQSFMLHQRKMMFAMIMVARTRTPPVIINELYVQRKVLVPKVPALGLLLEAPVYDAYNAACAKMEDGPDKREPIRFEPHAEKIEAFKNEFIYSTMRDIESKAAVFDKWMRSVDDYVGDDLLYLNPEGTVPEQAVIIPKQERKNRFHENAAFDKTTLDDDEIVDDGDEEVERPMTRKELEELDG